MLLLAVLGHEADRQCFPQQDSHLQENPLSQHDGAKNSFEGQCSARKVERLLQELRGRGIDLEAFEPDQLFEQIKGRTLWWVLPLHAQSFCSVRSCKRGQAPTRMSGTQGDGILVHAGS